MKTFNFKQINATTKLNFDAIGIPKKNHFIMYI